MTNDRLVALLTDLNTLWCVDSQVYQAWGIAMARFTFHIIPLSVPIYPRPAEEAYSDPAGQKHSPLQKNSQRGGYRRLPDACFYHRWTLRATGLVFGGKANEGFQI